MKIFVSQINPIVGNLALNAKKIQNSFQLAKQKGAALVVFPEMALIGYPPEDVLLEKGFVEEVEAYIKELANEAEGITAFVGCVRKNSTQKEKPLFNSCAILNNKKLKGYYDKRLLPTYDVFDERRFFQSGLGVKIEEVGGKKIAVTICEDIWQHAHLVGYGTDYLVDPIQELKDKKVDLLINLSASPYHRGKVEIRYELCSKAAKALNCPVLLVNQVGANDQLIFDGYSLLVDKRGSLIHVAKGFEEDHFLIDTSDLSSISKTSFNHLEDLYKALVLGVRDYFHKQGFKKACLGLSGGIDSAVVACIAKEALGEDNVKCLFMPSCYTSFESYEGAKKVATHLDVFLEETSIEKPFEQYLNLLKETLHEEPKDIVKENIQARIRAQILMAVSNQEGSLLLNTSNKSEMAMGYSTLYGDLCGGLAPIADVYKTQVYELAAWINSKKELIPELVLKRVPSAELKMNQKDTDTLPEYALLDALLEAYLEKGQDINTIAQEQGLAKSFVQGILKKLHQMEYKRRQAPLGLRVSRRAFCAGWRYPIVVQWNTQASSKL